LSCANVFVDAAQVSGAGEPVQSVTISQKVGLSGRMSTRNRLIKQR
jgi:hypothetical protein